MSRADIATFLAGGPFAVVGASRNRFKFGNQVLRSYLQAGRTAYPVNPTADAIEGHTCYPSLAALPEVPFGISIITPPPVTEAVVAEALELGIRQFWMQPGAESAAAQSQARNAGATVISGGPCLLVELGFPR